MQSKERLNLASKLEEQSALPEDWQTVVENACSILTDKQAVSFGIQCVARVAHMWTALFPQDSRVDTAIQYAKEWCNDLANFDRLIAASQAASEAGIEVDPMEELRDSLLIRAINAADAASSIADAAATACLEPSKRVLGVHSVAIGVGYAANFSLKASSDVDHEIAWQRSELIVTLRDEVL